MPISLALLPGCPHLVYRLALGISLAAAAVLMQPTATAGEATFVLREQLGQTWRDQLVTFPFEAPEGACHRRSVRLIGPQGPVPVQLVDVSYWDDAATFVRAAKAALFVDLDPGAALTFTLQYGPAPNDTAAPHSALGVERRDDEATLHNGLFGVTLLLGERRFEPPAAPSDVPGPVVTMQLADGRSFGGSRMFGDGRVSGYRAELTAAGPVFAAVRYRYEYADGNVLTLVLQLGERDSAVYFDMDVADDAPRDGIQFVLSRGLPPLVFPVQMEHFSQRPCFVDSGAEVGDWAELPLASYEEALVTRLTPWGDWWDDYTQTAVVFAIEGRDESLLIASRDPGAWVEPAPPGEYSTSGGRKHKMMPIRRAPDGEVFLEANLAAGEAGGVRRWSLGLPPARTPMPDREFGRRVRNKEISQRTAQRAADQRRLDVVKDYVLDWPRDGRAPHPHLFVSAADIARVRQRGGQHGELLEAADRLAGHPMGPVPSGQDCAMIAAWLTCGGNALAERLKLVERLRKYLGLLGDFDLMRHPTIVAVLYDCLIDTDLVPEAERPLFRAQLAYLAYRFADPATWSIERGYNSGLPNMSVSYILGLGFLACTIPDHPLAPEWIEPALRRIDLWLDRDIGPAGEWTESAHYSHVTASTLVAFAIAAKNAGFADLSQDERLKRLMVYLAKQYTPPDPTRGSFRTNPPLGRANAGARPGLVGAMARLTVETDPDISRVMQWTWKELGRSYNIYDERLAGTEYVYMDPSLPAERPDWQSDYFPRVGAILRHAFGTPEEHYINVLLNGDILFARPSEVGSVVKWFAFGRPIGGMFTGGYAHRHELLNSRVVLARAPETAKAWSGVPGRRGASRIRAFHAGPRMDYADAEFTIEQGWSAGWDRPDGMPAWPAVQREGEPPVTWRRQMLFVKGPSGTDASYLVLRDTVTGGQPTQWQFWTLSDGVVPAAEVRDPASPNRVEPDVPRLPARALAGDRFTAIGQLDVDVEYFVAAPRGTPRYTLRYGDTYGYPIADFREHQDLLQLRLPGDGSYYVVLFPRRRDETPPAFRTLADGAVIEVTGAWGTDYVLLADESGEVRLDDGVVLRGPAACAQRRTGEPPVVLTAP